MAKGFILVSLYDNKKQSLGMDIRGWNSLQKKKKTFILEGLINNLFCNRKKKIIYLYFKNFYLSYKSCKNTFESYLFFKILI